MIAKQIDSSTISSREVTKFYRLPSVLEITGLSRSTIYELITKDRFPKQFNLTGARSVGWLAAEVDAWCKTRLLSAKGNQL